MIIVVDILPNLSNPRLPVRSADQQSREIVLSHQTWQNTINGLIHIQGGGAQLPTHLQHVFSKVERTTAKSFIR